LWQVIFCELDLLVAGGSTPADFKWDGKLDVAAIGENIDPGLLAVLLSNGGGGFPAGAVS